jgi:hypothetical protein
MILRKLALASAFVLCMTILSGTAWADNVPVVNSAFEATSGPLNISCGVGCTYNVGSLPGPSVTNGASLMPGSYFTGQFVTISVPEPSSIHLLSIGMLFLLSTLVVRRKKELQLTA